MHSALKSLRPALLPLLVLAAACSGVQIKPDPSLPQPLVRPMTARAGLVLDADRRNFRHDETRYGGEWSIDLGPGHVEMMDTLFHATFSDVPVFTSLEEAQAATGLQVIFRPRIEQFSFATARDTTGGYWAVTIRYSIGVFSPDAQAVDSLAMTGYGSARSRGGNDDSLNNATLAAMRDASAKFLVQMPRQKVATLLRNGETVQVGSGAASAAEVIEPVPILP